MIVKPEIELPKMPQICHFEVVFRSTREVHEITAMEIKKENYCLRSITQDTTVDVQRSTEDMREVHFVQDRQRIRHVGDVERYLLYHKSTTTAETT